MAVLKDTCCGGNRFATKTNHIVETKKIFERRMVTMWDAILFMLNITWKVMILALVWTAISEVRRNGPETFKEILSTIGTAIRCGCLILKERLLLVIQRRKEEELINQAMPDDEPVNGQGTVK